MLDKSRSDRKSESNVAGPVLSLAVFILIFSSVRGWAVLNLNLDPNVVYGLSSMLLISLAFYGFTIRNEINNPHLLALKKLFIVNLFIGVCHILVSLVLGYPFEMTNVYIYLLPFIIFLFMRIDPRKIHFGIVIILVLLSFSIFTNAIISMTAEGIEYLREYNRLLRPSNFVALSSTGTNHIRVGGYTGSFHDSANILGMIGVYFYVASLVHQKFLHTLAALVALCAMFFTQSATNIVFAILVCVIASLVLLVKNPDVKVRYSILKFSYILALFIICFPGAMAFLYRLSPSTGDWAGMLNRVGLGVLSEPSFWMGFGYETGSNYIETEVAFLKLILEQGVFASLVFFYVFIYPLKLFMGLKGFRFELMPYLASTLFGFLSLSHYGSVLRSTNIGLFYAFYSLYLIELITPKHGYSFKRF